MTRAARPLLLLLIAACATTPSLDLLTVSVTITPAIDARTITGTQRLELRALHESLRTLRFDANALTLDSARANGEPATWQVVDGAVLIGLPRTYARGETVALDLAYRGAPVRGLTITDTLVYTGFFTCDWMFCALDPPGDKARFSVTVAAPPGWTTFAPSPLPESPVYTMGFATGRVHTFTQRAGKTEIVSASAHVPVEELRVLFADAPRMLAFFEDRAGVAFPHATYWQLVTQGDEAQEGAGFAVLGASVVRPMLTDPHEDWAVAHELAHTYWGNLVTCEDWTHFWLNEGLATFMTAAWKQARWGDADYAREIALAQRRWDDARSRGWDRPLAFSGAYPDLRTRRAIQYSKGMLFFVELRRTLGDPAFWDGLRAYTRRHAGGTVVSADLQRAFEASSGRDLAELFNTWVYE